MILVRFAGGAPDGPAVLSVRPERIAMLPDGASADNVATGRVASSAYRGAGHALVVETAEFGTLRVHLPAGSAPREGQDVRLGWSSADAVPVLNDGAEDAAA